MARRLLADPYDSAFQTAYVDWRDEYKFFSLLGRMRLDATLYDKIVVNDASIFDGIFFLAAASLNKLDELPWASIEVTARGSSLIDCIAKWSTRPNRKALMPVYHASLGGDCDVAKLGVALAEIDAPQLNSLEAYISLLRSVGLPSQIADRHLDAWKKLERLRSDGILKFEEWQQGFTFESLLDRTRKSAASVLTTSRGRETFREASERSALRGAVLPLLDAARVGASTEEVRDLETINTWYNLAYKRGQAIANRCDSIEIHVSNDCRSFSDADLPLSKRVRALQAANQYPIPDAFLQALGRLPREQYDALTKGDVAIYVDQWRIASRRDASDAWDALRRAADILIKSVVPLGIGQSNNGTAKEFVSYTAGVAAGAAVARGLRGAMASELMTRRFVLPVVMGAPFACGFVAEQAVEQTFETFAPNFAGAAAEAVVLTEQLRLLN